MHASAPSIHPTSSVPLSAPRKSPAAVSGGLALDASPSLLPSGAPKAPWVPTTVGETGQAGTSEPRASKGVAADEGLGPPPTLPILSGPGLLCFSRKLDPQHPLQQHEPTNEPIKR